ncbi:MAG: hypothetical protein A3D33_18970 [Candidatus Rokubacteria bacterium RIFCSPHIGHO2_02_FULL_73_26]|nr:MAG: hypothetical protein A3D33_18970 [Candidatus Rokubacteria bacterium RIFCSPHIGHO2_02_FULL_73_26]
MSAAAFEPQLVRTIQASGGVEGSRPSWVRSCSREASLPFGSTALAPPRCAHTAPSAPMTAPAARPATAAFFMKVRRPSSCGSV